MQNEIKRLGLDITDKNTEDELDNMIKQVPHKDDVLKKDDGLTKEITVGTQTLVFKNGQLVEIKN